MKILFWFAISVFPTLGAFASVNPAPALPYPLKPEPELTRISLCTHPDSYRYPERIPYCERDVSPQRKQIIFSKYARLGYDFSGFPRQDFKIDHYIPLCAGGSNSDENLWPQYRKVFEVTDELEQLLCEKMAQGRMAQRQAIDLIVRAKNDLSQVEKILASLGR